MKTNSNWWTNSPVLFNTDSDRHFYISNKGKLEYDKRVVDDAGIRPVITLKYGVDFIKGDGSQDNPYEVSINEKK